MTQLLEGRTAMVTGAGQGVGRGIALALAAAGASVVVAARRAETGEPVANEIRGRGGAAECVVCDVTERAPIAAAVARAVEKFGGLDIMVHNAFAGATQPHRLESVGADTWWLMSRTGTWASFWCGQEALPYLRRRHGRGRLILISSSSGVEGSVNVPLYSAVKGAQRAMAKSLAKEWGPLGITVNCIAPVAETPALAEAFTASPELKERLEARTPLGRVGDPEPDIGGVAVFLASDLGGYVTGQTVVADGGSFMGL